MPLILVAVVVIAPVVASYLAYYVFPRDRQVNYGTLLETRPAPDVHGAREDGSPFALSTLRGRWVLVQSDAAPCDAACERALYATRQARTMQGREQDRLVRVWVVGADAAPAASLVATHPGLMIVRVPDPSRAKPPGVNGRVYLVDPRGNLVLAYPDDPDPRGVANDLSRLLKASQIG